MTTPGHSKGQMPSLRLIRWELPALSASSACIEGVKLAQVCAWAHALEPLRPLFPHSPDVNSRMDACTLILVGATAGREGWGRYVRLNQWHQSSTYGDTALSKPKQNKCDAGPDGLALVVGVVVVR